MKHPERIPGAALAALIVLTSHAEPLRAEPAPAPYRVLKTVQSPGTGSIDYVYADSDDRRLYVPRGLQVLVFDLDTLAAVGSITNARARGVAVDPKSHHAFSSSSPVVMWDSRTLETLKTIEVKGRPDAIAFEPLTERIYVFSHTAPNATVIDAQDGSVAGTIDLGGAPEQACSDGEGHLYVAIEDKDNIAVVDVKTLTVTAHYDLGGKGGGPAGLGLDSKNHILFAMCHDPQTCVVLNAANGSILAALPVGKGTDGGGFNPATMEAFSSQGDGTMTIIKETSPTSFEVEQTVRTRSRAKTCTLDAKTNRILLITTEPSPTSPATTGAPAPTPAPGRPAGGRPDGGPSLLDILVVGRLSMCRRRGGFTSWSFPRRAPTQAIAEGGGRTLELSYRWRVQGGEGGLLTSAATGDGLATRVSGIREAAFVRPTPRYTASLRGKERALEPPFHFCMNPRTTRVTRITATRLPGTGLDSVSP